MLTELITWHAVTELLPDEEHTVLVYMPERIKPVSTAFMNGGKWFSIDDWPLTFDVLAWAEMPAGPQS